MTTLTHWLYAHHYSPVVILTGHTGWHRSYRMLNAVCVHHHKLTAAAVYVHHVVLYCYPK